MNDNKPNFILREMIFVCSICGNTREILISEDLLLEDFLSLLAHEREALCNRCMDDAECAQDDILAQQELEDYEGYSFHNELTAAEEEYYDDFYS